RAHRQGEGLERAPERIVLQPALAEGCGPDAAVAEHVAPAGLVDLAPQGLQRLPGPVAAPGGQARDQGGAVHGPGRAGGDGAEVQPAILEQPVDHPPLEGAVRPAALQSETDGARRAHWAVQPPSIGNAAPLAEAPRSDTR